MSNSYQTNHNALELIQKLENQGQTINSNKATQLILNHHAHKEMPLYIRALVGMGAFIASLSFITFLFQAKLISESSQFLPWGIIFIILAILFWKITTNDDSIKHSFILQLSFSLMTVGKSLFTSGMVDVLDSFWWAFISLFLVTLPTYYFYQVSIDRFVSSYATLILLFIALLTETRLVDSISFVISIYYTLQILAAAYLFSNGKVKNDYLPLAYALVCSIATMTLFLTIKTNYTLYEGPFNPIEFVIDVSFIKICLTLLLVTLILWSAGGLKKLKSEFILLAIIASIIIGVITAPGIILAIILMILGYAQHERLLVIIGSLLLPITLFFFYYSLNMTLLDKSITLITSGIVLLIASGYIKLRYYSSNQRLQ